jgi:hypothetical protein
MFTVKHVMKNSKIGVSKMICTALGDPSRDTDELCMRLLNTCWTKAITLLTISISLSYNDERARCAASSGGLIATTGLDDEGFCSITDLSSFNSNM